MNTNKQILNILSNLNHALSIHQLAMIQETLTFYITLKEDEEE